MWNESHNPTDREEFKHLRAMCVRLSHECHREYLEKTENSIRRNSNVFWSNVNGLKKPEELPYDIYFRQKAASKNLNIAGLFSERFSEVFVPTANSPPPIFNQVLPLESICDLVFVHANVFRHIQKLDNTFSSDHNTIPAL